MHVFEKELSRQLSRRNGGTIQSAHYKSLSVTLPQRGQEAKRPVRMSWPVMLSWGGNVLFKHRTYPHDVRPEVVQC